MAQKTAITSVIHGVPHTDTCIRDREMLLGRKCARSASLPSNSRQCRAGLLTLHVAHSHPLTCTSLVHSRDPEQCPLPTLFFFAAWPHEPPLYPPEGRTVQRKRGDAANRASAALPQRHLEGTCHRLAGNDAPIPKHRICQPRTYTRSSGSRKNRRGGCTPVKVAPARSCVHDRSHVSARRTPTRRRHLRAATPLRGPGASAAAARRAPPRASRRARVILAPASHPRGS